MEHFLTIEPHVYIDNENNLGYFRLDLKVNENANGLNPVPKDVYFMLDASLSISSNQLKQFTNGVSKGLQSLNPQDRFDIVVFSTKAHAYFKRFAQVRPTNIEKARGYLERTRTYGKTDVYNSIKPYINDVIRENGRPIQLFLMTDGVSTVSESMENSALIQKITKNNRADVSVFGFSCGKDINSFLLDFLTFKNRGGSLIYREVDNASRHLSKYIKDRSEIIVTDLNYKFMGEQNNIFPKKLPHLYRKHTLSIFGTFNPEKEESLIQVLGNSSGGSRQLIYKLKYNEATQADSTLAKHWASQKIFHLIGKLNERENADDGKWTEEEKTAIREIYKLKAQFKVYIPYKLPELPPEPKKRKKLPNAIQRR